MRIVFRCDGNDRVGAGHVARSAQLAEAFSRAGHEPVFVGHYDGLAADLLDATGFALRPPGPGPAGISEDSDAPVVVDSYEIPTQQLERLSGAVPVAAFVDGIHAPRVAAVLHYHLSPRGRLRLPVGTAALLGPDYAPVSPRLVAARRRRGFAHALVTVGGSEQARTLVEPAQTALQALGNLKVIVPGADGHLEVGLVEWIGWADLAISAAGTTAYELACAGVPTAAGVVADNQLRVAAGLARAGAARTFDARSANARERLAAEVAALGSAEERARLAIAGPDTVDGHGAARARGALLATFAGDRLPRVLRYRPAQLSDAKQLLAWRNDPEVRAASQRTEAIEPAAHDRWLEGVLADPDRVLWIIVEAGLPVGSLRFDGRVATAEISVSIAAERRGAGLGAQAVRESTELILAAYPALNAVLAEVRPKNARSMQTFLRAGYRETAEANGPMRVLRATSPVR